MRRTSCTSLASASVVLVLSACGTSARLEESRKKHAEVALDTIRMSAEITLMKTGKYPATLADVDVQRREDPWGNPFHYAVKSSGQRLEISSSGPDGVAGTNDDIWAME